MPSLTPRDYNTIFAVVLALGFIATFQYMKLRGRWQPGNPAPSSSRNSRAALITFGGLPILAYALTTIGWWLDQPSGVARAVFVYIAAVLPASLYVLFIATRRESLFNSYTANLDRLGLLRKRQLRANGQSRHLTVEDNLRLTRRVKSYLDRFGAVYGTLPEATVTEFLAGLQGEEDRTVKPGDVTGELFSSFDLKTILPVFAASALIALGWMMVLPPYPPVAQSEGFAALEQRYGAAWYLWQAEPVLVPTAFAFLGAYFFSIQMLVKRFMRRDLGPNAYNAVSMRIILAILGVWVACQWFEPTNEANADHGTLFVLSFAVGAFPLIVWQLVANVLKKLPGAMIALPNLEGTQPLSKIDGLSVWHEARLDEEDIENVPNLATADIVDLMLNTKISPNRIIDWVDQAILLMVLPPSAERQPESINAVLQVHGIRTGSALIAATQTQSGQKQAVVDGFPNELPPQARSLAAMVQIYPNYPLIQNWLSTEPYYPPDGPQEPRDDMAPPQLVPMPRRSGPGEPARFSRAPEPGSD